MQSLFIDAHSLGKDRVCGGWRVEFIKLVKFQIEIFSSNYYYPPRKALFLKSIARTGERGGSVQICRNVIRCDPNQRWVVERVITTMLIDLRYNCFKQMGERLKDSRRKYHKISYQKRLKLIDLVQNQQIGVTRASKKLRIKIPTAKVILSSYRQKGRIFQKKRELPQPHPADRAQHSPILKVEEQSGEYNVEFNPEHCLVYFPMVYVLPVPHAGSIINF